MTKKETAFYELYKVLPKAISDFMDSIEKKKVSTENSALLEIKKEATSEKRSILDQITFENYSYYLGFDDL